MKKLLLILCMLTGVAYAQFTPMTARGYQYKSVKVDSALFIPTFCGVPTFTISGVKEGAIGLDSCNNRFYYYNPKTNVWSIITSGSGSSGVDSVRLIKSGCTDTLISYKAGTGTVVGVLEHSNGLVSGTGTVVNTTGTTYNIDAAAFYINCVRYTTVANTIVLDAAGDTGRIDLIVANTSGVNTSIKGDEGISLTVPGYDVNTQFPLAFVLVTDTGVSVANFTDVNWLKTGNNIANTNSGNVQIGVLGAAVIFGNQSRMDATGRWFGNGSLEIRPNDSTLKLTLVKQTLDATGKTVLLRNASGIMEQIPASSFGGGGTDYNFANANLVATADRFHDFDGHSLNISTGANSSSSFIQDTVKFQWEVDDPAVAGKTRVNISDSTFVANSSNGATGGRIISGKDSIKVEVATSNHVQTMFISEEYLVYRYKDDSSGGTDSTYNVLFPQDYSRTDTLATKAYARSVGGGGGSGTVTSFGKVDGYGITSSVANSTTTPVHTVALDSATVLPLTRSQTRSIVHDSTRTIIGDGGIEFISGGASGVDTARLMASYTAEIDLSVSDFTITKVGNYKVISGSGTSSEEIYFPDPSLFDGQTITIWIPAGTDPAYTNSAFVPIDIGGNNIDRISESQVIIFKSMFGNWVGGTLSVVVQ